MKTSTLGTSLLRLFPCADTLGVVLEKNERGGATPGLTLVFEPFEGRLVSVVRQ